MTKEEREALEVVFKLQEGSNRLQEDIEQFETKAKDRVNHVVTIGKSLTRRHEYEFTL